MRVIWGLLAVAVFVVVTSVAMANTTTVGDPRGDAGGGLNLKSATAGHTRAGLLKHTIVQYNPIDKTNPPSLVINGGPTGACRSPSNKYYQALGVKLGALPTDKGFYRPCNGAVSGSFNRSYPNRFTVVYTFKRAAIGGPGRYFWAVRIHGTGEANQDELPNRSNPNAVCPGPVVGGTLCNAGWAQWMVRHKL